MEDGWFPSFPVSVYLANQVEASRSRSGSAGGRVLNEPSFRLDDGSVASTLAFVPQPVALDAALDIRIGMIGGRPQAKDQVAATKDAERRKFALSPPPSPRASRPRAIRAFQCPENLCAKTFISKRDLGRHVNGVHHKLFARCPNCSKQLRARDDNLKRHVDKFCKASKRQ
ncbi:hypothetical protein B0I37DRAFT_404241 [Chaetomium sp. MPI-CAGE-AT-0009]|nr:hypothetical protein B0I37DRAFT_404241 [Chaetomium sp. MPI-CAGE-AT-0009]